MKALRFELSGKNAFFKNPEVNSYYYFSYGNIHKPALLGIFGAILGYGGYSKKYEIFPEYYEKLKEIKVSTIPKADKGCFSKKIQYFNNTVGYASEEKGGNLIVKEQWLDNPSWTIYVMVNGEESEKLAEMILNKKCIYIPYLGKNDHPAVIEDVKIVELIEKELKSQKIHTIVPAEKVKFDWYDMTFKYEEYLPYTLNKNTNHYELKKFIYTDAEVEECKEVFSEGEKNIVFY